MYFKKKEIFCYTYIEVIDVVGGYFLAHSQEQLCKLLSVFIMRPLIAQKLAFDRLQLGLELVHFSLSFFQLLTLCAYTHTNTYFKGSESENVNRLSQ